MRELGDEERKSDISEPGPGTRCGGYTLVRRIGEGGMGEVFEAVQTSLKRRVAIKFLAAWATDSEQHQARFVREGEIAARMHHPNIVEVYDVGRCGERPYLVMELLDGCSLADALSTRGAMDEAKASTYLLPILSAMAAAHDRGVLHRDLKPENIFLAELDSGTTPKVLDFGISQVFTRRMEDHDTVMYGTPQYMSPEQASGLPGDERSDQYALGVILHEMVTGRPPFETASTTELLRAVRSGDYPRETLSGVSERLRDVILRATATDANDRFADVRDMGLALSRCAEPSLGRFWRAQLGAPRSEFPAPTPAHDSTPTQPTKPTASDTSPAQASRIGLMFGLGLLVVGVVAGVIAFRTTGPSSAPIAARPASTTATPPARPLAPARQTETSTSILDAAADGSGTLAVPTTTSVDAETRTPLDLAIPTGATLRAPDAGVSGAGGSPLSTEPVPTPMAKNTAAASRTSPGTRAQRPPAGRMSPTRPTPSRAPRSPWDRAATPPPVLHRQQSPLDPWSTHSERGRR